MYFSGATVSFLSSPDPDQTISEYTLNIRWYVWHLVSA